MSIIIVGGVLFGTILGRFFKIFILVPASALAVVLVLASPTPTDHSLSATLLEIAVLVTSLQVGYVVGLLTGSTSPFESLRGTSSQRLPMTVSRFIHIR